MLDRVRTFRGKRATVTVTAETAILKDGSEAITRFILTTESGYRAELPACRSDLCESGRLRPCALREGHSPNVRGALTEYGRCRGNTSVRNGFCHYWHWPSVERFAHEVLATYDRKPRSSGQVGIPLSAYRPEDYAPIRRNINNG